MRNKCKIKIGFLAVVLLLALAISEPRYFPALLCSTAIHESGHLLMGKIRKINLRELRLGVFGASLFPDSMNYSYKDEIILCAGGPLFNFLSAVLAVKVFSFSFDSLFVMSSFSLCILNLMPIMDLTADEYYLQRWTDFYPLFGFGGWWSWFHLFLFLLLGVCPCICLCELRRHLHCSFFVLLCLQKYLCPTRYEYLRHFCSFREFFKV